MTAESLATLLRLITALATEPGRPVVVAIDGRSGSGKTTLAASLAERLRDAAVVDGDSFYRWRSAECWDRTSAADNADRVIDRVALRAVVETLRAGEAASWFGFDWRTHDDTVDTEPTRCRSAAVIIVDGVYSGHPDLAELVDLRVLITVDDEERSRRLRHREGPDEDQTWAARWAAAEDAYYATIMAPQNFDVVLPG